MKSLLRSLLYTWRRIRDTLLGRDVVLGQELANLRRLMRAGRVTFGRETYGVPNIPTYIHDTTRLRVGNYTSIAGGSTIMWQTVHKLAVDRRRNCNKSAWLGAGPSSTKSLPDAMRLRCCLALQPLIPHEAFACQNLVPHDEHVRAALLADHEHSPRLRKKLKIVYG